MSHFLKFGELCPIHHSRFCEPCHRPRNKQLVCQCGHARGDHEGMGPSRGRPAFSACGLCSCNQWRPQALRVQHKQRGGWKSKLVLGELQTPRFKPAVLVIEDPHAPKGYREICNERELRRRKVRKIEEQHGCCAGPCGREFGSFREAQVAYLWPEKHHIRPSKMGGGFRDDSYDNLEILCSDCHRQKTGIPQWSKSA